MKNKKLMDSWNKIEPDKAAQERMLHNIFTRTSQESHDKKRTAAIKKSLNWKPLALIAAFLAIAVTAAIPFLNEGGDYDLKLSDSGIKVNNVQDFPEITQSSSLEHRTEQELINETSTDIFVGTVKDIQNIHVDYNGADDYRAIATIEVGEILKGKVTSGDIVTILLPGPINMEGIWVEDTEVTSKMKVGMTGIFMPRKYDRTDFHKANGKRLYLLDIAEYGLMDGERYTFLQTDSGLAFADWAYPSLNNAQTLDDIKTFIKANVTN